MLIVAVLRNHDAFSKHSILRAQLIQWAEIKNVVSLGQLPFSEFTACRRSGTPGFDGLADDGFG